tara:strand:+ start:1208 stop:1726 length:519 start_codon:yes stop_codon:yes gene_type:complete
MTSDSFNKILYNPKGFADLLYSPQHLFFGFLYRFAFFPYSPFISFILGQLFHLTVELTENTKAPDGKILESTKNHLGDQFFFTLGWIWAQLLITLNSKIFKRYLQKKVIVYFFKIFVAFAYIFEILRESFPENKIFGAYNQTDKSSHEFVAYFTFFLIVILLSINFVFLTFE